MMNQKTKGILRKVFCNVARKERVSLNLTQEQMAEVLQISTRAYVEIEHGKHCCSGETMILLLLNCRDREAVLADIQKKLEEAEDEDFIR